MSAGTALAVYDFDGTLIAGDSIVAYLRFARSRGFLPLRGLLAAALDGLRCGFGRLSPGEAKRRALRFREKLTAEEQTALDGDFAELLFSRLRPGAICQMAQDQAAGRFILLLSASTDNYMVPFSRRLGADGLICTRIAGLPEDNCRGEAKVGRLKAWLAENRMTPDFPASAAYGDSEGDAAVLALVGCAVAAYWLYRVQKKEFGGMSGDLSGYFLQLAELFMLMGLLTAQAMI